MRQGGEQVEGSQAVEVALAHCSGRRVVVTGVATAAAGLVITPFLAGTSSPRWVPGRQVITHVPTGRHVVATPSGHQGVAIGDARMLCRIARQLVVAGFGDWTAVDPASALPGVGQVWQRAVDAEYVAWRGA